MLSDIIKAGLQLPAFCFGGIRRRRSGGTRLWPANRGAGGRMTQDRSGALGPQHSRDQARPLFAFSSWPPENGSRKLDSTISKVLEVQRRRPAT